MVLVHKPRRPWRLVLTLCALLALAAGRARAQMAPEPVPVDPDPLFDDVGADLELQGQGFPDPFEGFNRGTLEFNLGFADYVLDPVTTVYRFAVPEPGRHAVRNVLSNLNAPATLVNDVLQLEIHDAGVTTARFLVNSTVGIGGIFDVGDAIGLPGHHSDFGQTLARAGVPSGPFLILPVFGPTTLRDGTGAVIDTFLRPTFYILAPADVLFYTSIQGTTNGVAEWDSQSDNLQQLEDSSIDYYAALRSAYYQNRIAEIRGHDTESASLAIAAE